MNKPASAFLLFLFILTGCSLVDDTPPAKFTLTPSKLVYTAGGNESITVTASVTGKGASSKAYWKLDGGEYKEDGLVKTFGPFSDSASHMVKCSVENFSPKVITLKSSVFESLTPVQRYGRLQVKGVNLCSESGDPVQLRGMSTHGIQYFPNFYTENLVKSFAQEWKGDIIRVSCYVNEGWGSFGSYLDTAEYWISYVDKMVDWAEAAGIYVLIDWHMLTPGDPNYYVTEAEGFWRHMAEKHGSKKHVLFDICNEPNNEGLTNWSTGGIIVPSKNVSWGVIRAYADRIMPIIRAKSENVAIVGTPEWASRPDAVIGNKLAYSNVMYTMHFYAADHKESYRNGVERAIQGGVPVFVTEFGTQEASGDQTNDFGSSEAWMELMDQYSISWCCWNLSSDWRTGAAFKRYTDDKADSLNTHMARYEEDGEGTPITSEEEAYVNKSQRTSFTSAADYSNPANMKEAGKWIFNKIKNRN